MRANLFYLTISILIPHLLCLPTLYFQSTINIPAGTLLLAPEISPYQGSQLMFVPTITTDNKTYALYSYNISGGIPTALTSLSYTFVNTIVDCSISTLKDHLLLSF